MDIKYGNFSFLDNKLSIPVISTSTDLNFTDGGAVLGGTLNITLQGKIIGTGELNNINNYDKPQTKTSWFDIIDLINKIESGFSKDYQELKITCGVGAESEPKTIWGLDNIDPHATKVNSIKFTNNSDSNWSQVVDYSIELQTEITGITDYIAVGQEHCYVSSIENSYSIEPITDNSFYITNPLSSNRSARDIGFRNSLFPYISGEIFFPGYTITRRLSATGRASKPRNNNPLYRSTAIQNAKSFVTGLLYYDTSIYKVLNNLTIFDRITTIDANDTDGRYSINDTFIAYSGVVDKAYTEKFNITNAVDDKFNRTVTIEGSIQGLKKLSPENNNLYWNIADGNGTKDYLFPTYKENNQTAYNVATGVLDNLIKSEVPYYRCLSVSFPSGFLNRVGTDVPYDYSSWFSPWSGWLNPIPVNTRIQHDIAKATVDYTFVFNSRPMSLVSGAISEDISVEDNYSTREMTTQTIFKRNPLLQDFGTYSIPSRTVSYNAKFPIGNISNSRLAMNSSVLTMINTAIQQFNPKRMDPQSVPASLAQYYYYHSWITENNENFNPLDGSFRKTLTWNYELRYIYPPRS